MARLLRYGTRPAFAQERLSLENGRVVYKLPKPFWTGQIHVILEPLEFLRRLAALIPTPRFHTIRYHGFFAAAAKDRAGACALAPPVDNSDDSDAMAQNANERRCVHGPGDDPASASNREAMSMANGDSTDDPDRDAPYRLCCGSRVKHRLVPCRTHSALFG